MELGVDAERVTDEMENEGEWTSLIAGCWYLR